MNIGFSGSRHGMTAAQKSTLHSVLFDTELIEELHHGDCVGADDQAANMVRDLCSGRYVPAKVFVHPPEDESRRAFNPHCDVMMLPLSYQARNRNIVAACDLLIACPCDMEEQPCGGTWQTVRFAKKAGKPVKIIWPDGTTEDR